MEQLVEKSAQCGRDRAGVKRRVEEEEAEEGSSRVEMESARNVEMSQLSSSDGRLIGRHEQMDWCRGW